jgi:hypothetical protein
MRLISGLRAMWLAITSPMTALTSISLTAMAMLAIAVLVRTAGGVALTYVQTTNPALSAQTVAMNTATGITADETEATTNAARTFTAVLGGALMQNVVGILLTAALFMGLARFLTNAPVTFGGAITGVAAATLIGTSGELVTVLLQLSTGSIRAVPGMSALADPVGAPFLYMALYRVNPFEVWQALATGIMILSAAGLPRNFGIVVGIVAWTVIAVVAAGSALLSGLVSGRLG